jgi:hypothetical protein
MKVTANKDKMTQDCEKDMHKGMFDLNINNALQDYTEKEQM